MGVINFYLAHYYDKDKKQFVPFLYTNVAENVMLDVERDESVADAITQLQDAKVYTLSELIAHTGNAGIHVNGGEMQEVIATLNSFIAHADNLNIHVTPSEKAAYNATVETATGAAALAAEAAGKVTQFESRIARLEDGLFNDITGNPFLITFDALSGLTITKGIWNAERQRVEC